MSEKNNNSFGVALFGLVLGFAAGAATIILSDPEKRQVVKEKSVEALNTVSEKSKKLAEKVRDTADNVSEEA